MRNIYFLGCGHFSNTMVVLRNISVRRLNIPSFCFHSLPLLLLPSKLAVTVDKMSLGKTVIESIKSPMVRSMVEFAMESIWQVRVYHVEFSLLFVISVNESTVAELEFRRDHSIHEEKYHAKSITIFQQVLVSRGGITLCPENLFHQYFNLASLNSEGVAFATICR